MLLEVMTGANQGEVHDISEEVIIGRSDECTIRLQDPSVSGRHAKIVMKPKPQVIDLGSANGIMVNGEKVSTSDLVEGDVLNIGGVTLHVHMAEAKKASRIKNPKRLAVLVVGVLLFFGIIGGSYYMRTNLERRTGELVATQFKDKPNYALPGIKVRMPDRDDFNVPLTALRSSAPRWLTMKERPGYASSSELALVEVFPPDPITRGADYGRRQWNIHPPRLGNGRFLPEAPAVLGVYYMRNFVLGTTNWSNPTPPEFLSTVRAEETPLRVEFTIEVWDGLPPSAQVPYFSLDRTSSVSMYEKTALVPKQLQMPISRENFIAPRTEWEQNAQGYIKAQGNNYQYFVVKQEKKGGTLVILTAKTFAWQQTRVDDLIDELIAQQEIVGRDYDKPEERIARALELEKEADQLLPNVLEIQGVENWNLISNRWEILRAFNRYHQALVYLQQADKWPHDEDYTRIFAKAEAIYNYVQHPRGYFRTTYTDIERAITELNRMRAGSREAQAEKRKKTELVDKKVQELLDITRRGQDPAQFPVLDEWFIYAHMRRLYINSKWPR